MINKVMKNNHKHAVEAVIHAYFDGLHFANISQLESIFCSDCVLKAPGIRRDLKTWLSLVAQRPVPAKLGHPYKYKILTLEVMEKQAMAKVYCPLIANEYIDYLGLLFEGNQWKIVNKMYADK